MDKLTGEVFYFLNMMSQRTQNRDVLHIPVPIWSLSVFGNFPAKPPFFKRLQLNHAQFLWKGSHSKYPAVAFQKDKLIMNHMQYYETEFSSKDILSIRIQCGEFTALSKHLFGYRALLHWIAQFYTRNIIILHSKYPLDLEFNQTWSATYRLLSTDRSTASMLFTVTSSPLTWFTWPPLWRASHFPSWEIFIAREQWIFHSDSDRH